MAGWIGVWIADNEENIEGKCMIFEIGKVKEFSATAARIPVFATSDLYEASFSVYYFDSKEDAVKWKDEYNDEMFPNERLGGE